MIPQSYPLFVAVDGEAIRYGRVVAWLPEGEGYVTPVVAWDSESDACPVTADDVWFVGETREEAADLVLMDRT